MANMNRSLDINLHQLQLANLPSFSKPKEVSSFSLIVNDQEPSQKDRDDLARKYTVPGFYARALSSDPVANCLDLVAPSSMDGLDFDLKLGYDTHIKEKYEGEYIKPLLQSLDDCGLVGSSEFVCKRGLLIKIATSPYDASGRFDNGTKIAVQKVGGVLYMTTIDTETTEKISEQQEEKHNQMSYWGLKFESYVSAKPGEKPDIQQVIDSNLKYNIVVDSKLGKHSLVYSGEIDCAWPENRKRYVELKTAKIFSHPGNERPFRRNKLLNWWAQSFLIGVEDILCGFRDEDGVVKHCKWYKVSKIPQIIQKDRNSWAEWHPSVCLKFLEEFLDFVKVNVTEDLVPHVISRAPASNTFHLTVARDGEYKFLPQWFVEKYSEI